VLMVLLSSLILQLVWAQCYSQTQSCTGV